MKLQNLLEEGLRFSPVYGAQGKLFTHLPMALYALAQMGASDDRLEAFAALSTKKLQLKQPCEAILPHEWLDYLGQAEYYAGYEQMFAQSIQREGIQPVLLRCLPDLLPGAGSAAFHALIRLAYALDADFEPEIAAALASWAVTYSPLPLLQPQALNSHRHVTLSKVLEEVRQQYLLAPPTDTEDDFIMDRMIKASRYVDFAAWVSQLQATHPKLQDLAACSLAVYRHSFNFTALHMVTATHAARGLIQLLPQLQAPLMQHLLPAWLAAWVSIGCTPVDLKLVRAPGHDEDDWATQLRCATQSDNEHAIKICYTAWCEHQHYGFGGYRDVASHVTHALTC